MEKNKTLKARILALVLTVLMVVGVLPMSVFALTGEVDNGGDELSTEYLTPDVGDMVKAAYNSDSKYWTTVVNTDNASSKYGATGTQYIAGTGSMSSAYFQVGVYNGTVPVSETGNVIHFPQDTTIKNSGWSKNAYNSMITWNGIRVSGSTAYGTIKGGYAGIDHALTADICLKEDSVAGSASLIYCLATSPTYVDYCEILNFVCDENGNFSLHVGSRRNGTSVGKKLCDLPAGEYFKLQIVFDVGNEANEFYVFVDGEYVGGANLLNGGFYSSVMATAAAASAEVEGGCPQGIMLTTMSFNSGAVYYDLKDAGVYFYDDTPEDGVYKNATRGAAVGVFYENDFEGYDVGANLNGTTLSYGSFVSNATVSTGQINYVMGDAEAGDTVDENGYKLDEGGNKIPANAATSYLVVDANGNKALQPNVTAPDSYFDIWPSFSNWSIAAGNSGRSFVLSAKVKGSGLKVSLFGIGDRAGTSPAPVVLAADGTLRLNYAEGVGANTSIGDTNAMPILAKLSKDEFTAVALVVNVPENYFEVYVDGKPVTEKLIFLSDASIATVNNHTTTPKEGEPYKTFENGFALSSVRMNYSGGATGKTWTYDDMLFYWGDEYNVNYVPSGERFVTPDGDDIAAKVGAENVYLYDDFNSATAASDSAIKASASYLKKYAFHSNGATWNLIDDGNGGKAFNYYNDANTNLNFYFTDGFRTYPDTDTVGKTLVVSADIKAGQVMTDGQLFSFSSYAQTNNNNYCYTAIAVYVMADGTLYVPDASNGIVTILNGWKGTSYYKAIGKLSKDSFTNVAVQINPGENWFKVYVDGVAMTDKLLLANADTLATYEAANAELLTGKGYTPTSWSFGYRGGAGTGKANHYYVWDNMAAYYSEEVVTKYVPVFSEGEVTGGIVGNAPVWTAPDGDAVKAALGESSLLYYNNFNDGTTNGSAVGNWAFTRCNGWQFVDVAEGNKAPQTKSGQQQNSCITLGKNHDVQVATLAGKSFVFSGDFKLGACTTAGALFYFAMQVNASTNAYYTAMPVWIDAAGNLYNGQMTTTSGVITGGTLWRQNAITNASLFTTADKKIGALSADKFTNIAVAVDVPNNTYDIYVNGVCVAKDQLFACDGILNDLHTVDAENGTEEFAAGFGLKQVCLGYRDAKVITGDSYIFDNWLVYEGTDLVGWSDDTRELVYDYSDVNGYYEADGLNLVDDFVIYVENGTPVANMTSADGILTTDEDGKVMLNGEYVKSMDEVYRFVNDGDILPVDGIYTDGLYQANKITGVNYATNLYYFDAEGNLVKDSDCIDVDGIPYTVGANGIVDVYTGIYNNKYYENSAALVNTAVTVGEDVYYAGEDGTFQAGVYEYNGEDWLFDPVTFKGEKIVVEEGDSAIIDKDTGVKYNDIQSAMEGVEEEGTLKLYGDMTSEEAITFDKAITVDLNGNTISSPSVTITAGTQIVVSADNKGYIDVPKGQLTIARTTQNIVSYFEEGEGYTFATARKQEKAEVPAPESEVIDGFTLVFRPTLDLDTDYNQKIFGNGTSGVQFEVHLRTADGTTIKRFVVEDDTLVQRVYNEKMAFKLTVRGASVNYNGQELSVVYVLSSDTGMQCEIASDVKFTPKAAVTE